MTYYIYNASFLGGQSQLESISMPSTRNESVNFISSFSLKILLNNLATSHHSYSYQELSAIFFRSIDNLVNSLEQSHSPTILVYQHNHHQFFEYGNNELYQKLYQLAQLILEKFQHHQLALFYSQSLTKTMSLASLVYLLKNKHQLSHGHAKILAHQILYFRKNGINGNLAYQQEGMAFANFIKNDSPTIA